MPPSSQPLASPLAARRKAISSAVAALALLVVPAESRATTAPELPLSNEPLTAGELKLGLGGSALVTTTNFNLSGSKQSQPANGSFSSLQGDLFAQYGLFADLTVLLDLPFARNTVTGPTTIGNAGLQTNTALGAGDLTAGLRFAALREPVELALDGLIQYPLYARLLSGNWANLSASGPVPVGTGVTEFTLLARVVVPAGGVENLGIEGDVGLTARTGGFSDLLPYALYVKYEEPRGWFARVGVKGYFTIMNDQYTSTSPLPNDRSTAVEDFSQAYNAVNPSVFSAAVAGGAYVTHGLFVNVGAELPLVGRDVPAQPLFVAAVGFDLGGKAPETKLVNHHSNRGFQEYYLAAKVVRVNNQLHQVLIDKGAGDLVRQGEYLDIFAPDANNGTFGETVARGRAIQVGPTKTKIQVLEFFKDGPLQEGFVVRRPVR